MLFRMTMVFLCFALATPAMGGGKRQDYVSGTIHEVFLLLGIGEPDCSKDGKADMREVYRESLEIIDRIELERQKARGGLTEDAIELRSELREKQDEMSAWAAHCQSVVGPRRTGKPLK